MAEFWTISRTNEHIDRVPDFQYSFEVILRKRTLSLVCRIATLRCRVWMDGSLNIYTSVVRTVETNQEVRRDHLLKKPRQESHNINVGQNILRASLTACPKKPF